MKDDKRREDFFYRLSEGNEIKLTFFKNLYKIITVSSNLIQADKVPKAQNNKIKNIINLTKDDMRQNKFLFNKRNPFKKETKNHSFSHKSIERYKKDYNININIQNPNYKHLEIDYNKGNEKIIVTTLPTIK
jgi:hypothetical protein